MKRLQANKGISLVEVVFATAIFLGIVLGVLGAYSFFIRTALSNTKTLQATMLLEEGAEVLRFLRDGGWSENISGLSPDSIYALSKNGSEWSVTGTPEYIGEFERTFSVSFVYRDANDDISQSGIQDESTLFLTVRVSWSDRGATTTRELPMYMSNIFE